MEISIVDLFFAVWGGVMTALWVTSRKELQYNRKMMVEMVKDLHEGTIEIVKSGNGYRFEIAKEDKK